jgi:hypothetical protein
MSCIYCEDFEIIEIKEAYGNNKQVNEQIELCLQPKDKEPSAILSIDYATREASGFYVDISYCPFCGKKLE